jgi:hypothetical protein
VIHGEFHQLFWRKPFVEYYYGKEVGSGYNPGENQKRNKNDKPIIGKLRM